jgi:two-component system, NarL family, nitrate/nitrite response regulator NarL
MTQATAPHSQGGALRVPPTGQRPSAAAGTGPGPARASEDPACVAGCADREPERGRNARDLDDVAQKGLLGIAMAADSLASQQWSADPHVLDDKLRQLARLARQAVILARSAAGDRHDDAPVDAVRSVPPAASAAADDADADAGLAAPPASPMTEALGKEIIGILREALVNAEAGSHAFQAQVALRMAGSLLLIMAGDGVGFRPPADPEVFRPVTLGSYGSVREHARSLGGEPLISSWRHHGPHLDAGTARPEMTRPLHAVPSPAQVRVVIADGSPVRRAGLRAVLDAVPTTTVVAEAADMQDAVRQVQRHQPDVLLLDAGMPLRDGLATIRRLGQLTEVVMLDSTDDASSDIRSVPFGVGRDSVPGQLDPGELIRVLLNAARPDPEAPRRADPFSVGPLRARDPAERSRPVELRPREREIMEFIAEGLSNRQIADRLVISEKTVKNHICSIYQRLGVQGRSQAISRWRDQ